MTQRNADGKSYTFAYDAENRLVAVSGDSTATFVYNGDGQRVKSVMDGETTLFVGGHYEITNPGAGQTVTKYYMAGATRVAVRKDGTLSYMLADHLGSTSLVTDTNGNRTSELRYKPWGETRFSFGTMPTKYTFTGQFSYTDDPSTPQAEGFGLMYFNARWMDPSLGRFAQADTIIPRGVQGLDRYAYTDNNPIKYTDPSGHWKSGCNPSKNPNCDILSNLFGWNVSSNFSSDEIKKILETAIDILAAVTKLLNNDSGLGLEWMRNNIGDLWIVKLDLPKIGDIWDGESSTSTPGLIHLEPGWDKELLTHELGHTWDYNSTDYIDHQGAKYGLADDYNLAFGGTPSGCRFCLSPGVSPNVPQSNLLPYPYGYGNRSTADYFAESFKLMIYHPEALTTEQLVWMQVAVIGTVSGNP
jgi:RHS repeat-associated protein